LPAFTKGKAYLSSKEVKESKELARVRIHMDRMIGMITVFRKALCPLHLL